MFGFSVAYLGDTAVGKTTSAFARQVVQRERMATKAIVRIATSGKRYRNTWIKQAHHARLFDHLISQREQLVGNLHAKRVATRKARTPKLNCDRCRYFRKGACACNRQARL